MTQAQNNGQDRYGFKNVRGGTHLARTMMLEELQRLLSYVDDPSAGRIKYLHAIETDNCLAKRSGRTRELTARHLANLYVLDPALTLFRTLRFFLGQRSGGPAPFGAYMCLLKGFRFTSKRGIYSKLFPW